MTQSFCGFRLTVLDNPRSGGETRFRSSSTLDSGNSGASERRNLDFSGRKAVADPLSTQALIEQVQQGDDDALQEICCRYQMRVLTAVRIRLGANLRKKLESSDIVQEVMIDALRKVKSFEFRTEVPSSNTLIRWSPIESATRPITGAPNVGT